MAQPVLPCMGCSQMWGVSAGWPTATRPVLFEKSYRLSGLRFWMPLVAASRPWHHHQCITMCAARTEETMTSAGPPSRVNIPARLPQRQVLADDVYEAVKALVMDHVIAPGARVSIDGLARQLGVSQTPIREALARLESDGLVTKEPLRGYRAPQSLTRSEGDDLFQFRLLIEPWAASRAAEL